MDEQIPFVVRASRFENKDPIFRVGTQPIRQRTTSRTTANDQEIPDFRLFSTKHQDRNYTVRTVQFKTFFASRSAHAARRTRLNRLSPRPRTRGQLQWACIPAVTVGIFSIWIYDWTEK